MIAQRRFPRIARWGVPAGAVALTGVVAAGFAMSGAQAAPSLPSRTPVQLLAAVNSARVLPPMTAVVQESAALGIPSLPNVGTGDALSALSWLSGSHTVKIWYADPAHVRMAVPVQLGESDVRRDGRNVWYWSSKTNQATHLVLPAGAATAPQGSNSTFTPTAPTPQQLAKQALAAVGPTTKVGLQQNVSIAGQPAYQISLAPKDSRSLIGEIRIAIDAQRALPLRVQIFARGSGSPAFQVGFTSLQFGTPAASNFAFTAPPGAQVKTITVPAGAAPGMLSGLLPGLIGANGALAGAPGRVVLGVPATVQGSQVTVKGSQVTVKGSQVTVQGSQVTLKGARALQIARAAALKGTQVRLTPAQAAAALQRLRRAFAAHLPKNLTAAQRAAAVRQFDIATSHAGRVVVNPATGATGFWTGYAPLSAPPPALRAAEGLGLPSGAGPTVLGKDWLTVVVIPANGLAAVSEGQITRVPAVHFQAHGGFASGSHVVVRVHASPTTSQEVIRVHASEAPPHTIVVPDGPNLAILGALLRSAKPVHGAWGSGRLLTTSLVSVLVTSNGKILIGAVTPAVLYADAAQVK
jgi:outer membrane lipoprotein-sorting protein